MADVSEPGPGDPTSPEGTQAGLDAAENLELWQEEGLFRVGRIREEHSLHDGRVPSVLREPCRFCGATNGSLVKRSNQNTVRCGACNRFLYNAPKTETGEVARTVKTLRKAVKPSQQARILDRDNGRCVLCGRSDQPLVIGHLLSVDDGAALGATERELYDDVNLAAMCEACNLGLGGRSISPRTYAVIMYRLLQAERMRRDDECIPSESLIGAPSPAPAK